MPRVPLSAIEVPEWAADLKPLDSVRVQALALDAERAGKLAPIHVASLGSRLVLLDGRHRLHAARALGWTDVEAEVVVAVDESDAIAAAVRLAGPSLSPDAARKLAARLTAANEEAKKREATPGNIPLDPRRRRLLRELLIHLHDKKRVQDARLAQLFDIPDAAAAARLRVDARGLPALEPLALHEMPPAVALGVRELAAEGLLAREEVEHLFPLNEREKLHLRAERALRTLLSQGEERVKLKGTRWGPDWDAGAPQALRIVAEWPDGTREEKPIEEVPGLDRHTAGIVRRAFVRDGGPRA